MSFIDSISSKIKWISFINLFWVSTSLNSSYPFSKGSLRELAIISIILLASLLLSIIFIKSFGKNGLISLKVIICSFNVSSKAFISFSSFIISSTLSTNAISGFLSKTSNILPLVNP